jgi:hypothetical protein
MSKWEKVMDNRIGGAGSRAEQVQRDHAFNKMSRALVHNKTIDLKKEGDEAFVAQKAREDSLVAAFDEKKLKSKTLIKEAKAIIAKREKDAKAKKTGKETAECQK